MPKQYSAPVDQKIDPDKKYTATIETTEGTITADLYPKIAPQTVNAFVFLARDGRADRDVNPLAVLPKGAVALDALAVPKGVI